MFTGVTRRKFEDNRAVAQGKLDRQEDLALSPAAEFGEEQEVTQGIAHCGELGSNTRWAEKALAIEEYFQLRLPLWKAAQHLFEGHFRAIFLPQAEFFVDQIGGGFGVLPKLGVPRQQILGKEALAVAPPLDHFLDQLRRQGFGRFAGQ